MNGRSLFPDTDTSGMSVDTSHRSSWVESSGGFETDTRSEEFLGPSLKSEKMTFFLWCIGVVLSLFFVRTVYLQIIRGNGFSLLSDKNKIRTVILPSHRGIIFDANGTALVHNVPNFVLQITPSELSKNEQERQSLFSLISETTGIPIQEIQKTLSEKSPFQKTILAEHIPYEKALQFISRLTEGQGVELVASEGRQYVTTDLKSLSHVLGYIGRITDKELKGNNEEYQPTDSLGKEGLERYYELVMRGKPGKKEIEVDALGSEKGVLSEEQTQDGKNLVLTIQLDLQKKAEQALTDVLKKFNKKKGVVIVSKGGSGEILALVSLPSYDSNDFSNGISHEKYNALISDKDQPLYNRVIYGEYPSGSTIKPVVAAAALQEGVVTENTTIMSVGGIHINKWFFPDWKAGGHGPTRIFKALAESVNTYFYTIGGGYETFQGLGADRLIHYFKLFGIGEKTGIDLPSERSGFVPTQEWKKKTKGESWYIGDTYHISIGQGDILVTPLHIAGITSYFANNGVWYKFHLLKKILGSTPDAIEEKKNEVWKKDLVAHEHVQSVRKGMRETILTGSGRSLSNLGVSVAGKTGTAQWGVGKQPHAWFTGWAPYDNPQIVVTVLIEEGEEGSRTSIRVAEDIIKWYFKKNKYLAD